MSDPTYYTPEEDKTKTLDDGREVLVAAKGIPILRARAVELGILEESESEKAQEPQETQPPGGPQETQGVPKPGELKSETGQPGSEVAGTLEEGGAPLTTGTMIGSFEPTAESTPLEPVEEPPVEERPKNRKKD